MKLPQTLKSGPCIWVKDSVFSLEVAEQMDISVVIPCYNAAPFIGDCLKSVAEQTKQPHEVIVIDDGSTDASCQIINKAPIQVRLLHTGRRGGAGARNAGIKVATGDWIAFLDADDLWFPDHLERASRVIRRTGAVAYINHYNHIKAGDIHIRNGKVQSEVTGTGIDDYIALFRHYGHFVGMSACLVQTRCAREVGGLLENQLRRHDIEFWLRIIHNRPWVFDPLATSAYRKHSQGNLSSDRANAAIYGFTAFLRHRVKAQDMVSYDTVLKERARSAITQSFEAKDQVALRQSYSMAFDYLGPMHKILFQILYQAPCLFPVVRLLRLV